MVEQPEEALLHFQKKRSGKFDVFQPAFQKLLEEYLYLFPRGSYTPLKSDDDLIRVILSTCAKTETACRLADSTMLSDLNLKQADDHFYRCECVLA